VPEKYKVIIGYGNAANYITFSGLQFALASCYCALEGNIQISIILLIAAGICDMFDGLVARKLKKRTPSEMRFGIQLDSLVDQVCFGVTPAVIVFSVVGKEWYVFAACALYVVCAVDRLAYFNSIVAVEEKITHYRGLPVTTVASLLPAVYLFLPPIAGVITLAVLALLFVLNIKIPKARGIWYGLFSLLAAALIIAWSVSGGFYDF
jgi:CDP-diacylglycerol--serine O-phosphatidyltransferase